MKKISLDSILLFAFVTPFIMTYRLSPAETPYFLFTLIFLGLLLYLILDLSRLEIKLYFKLKQILLWLLIIGILGSSFVSAIIVRHKTAPIYNIHDIVLQQEAAIRFLIEEKNPYAVTYFGTPLKDWHYSTTEINPALYHFVMEPFYLLFALPFYFLSLTFFGFFDGRMPLLTLFFILLVLAARLVKDHRKQFLFLIFLAFNPAILGYTLEGRSDIFMFTFLFTGLYLLYKRKYFLSGILVALSFGVKQSAWPFLPFYLAFLYFETKSFSKTVKVAFSLIAVFLIITLPFFLWDKKAFLESTIFYLSGNVEHGYPISGYGLGMVLYQLGFIKNLSSSYPFIIWQIIIGLPLMVILLKFLKNAPTVSRLIFVYGFFLFVFWYLSRYFNNSHLAFLSMVFITAYFWPLDAVRGKPKEEKE